MWAVLIAGITAVSAFTIHQHSKEQYCVDLQCPATAFDYGVRNLVSEEALRSEECKTCQQCTDNGYSICMQMKSTRASRTQSGPTCSCAHSVPANCHNKLINGEHPANITMSLYQICYLSALQAPPKALVTNEVKQVVIEIEPFWKEDYWRELEVDNLTLYYDYLVKVPEHCDGEVITKEGGVQTEHLCTNTLYINMTATDDADSTASFDDSQDDYEHSDNYDQYDDELPPDVGIDRIVFAGAKLLTVYYKVDVRRPRQLESDNSDPFRDVTTTVESEVVKFDLKPETFGTGEPPVDEETPNEKVEEDALPTDAVANKEEEDVSEEPGEGTDFFEEGPKTKSNEEKEDSADKEAEEEEEELEKKIKEDVDDEEENEKEQSKGEDDDEETVHEDQDKEESAESTTVGEVVESHEDEVEEKDGLDDVHHDADQKENDADEREQDNQEDADEDEQEEKEEEQEAPDNQEDDDDEDEDEKENEEFDGSGDGEDVQNDSWYSGYFRKHKMFKYACLAVLAGCAVVLLTWLCCRLRCCCLGSAKSKEANGYRYTNPNRNTDLVSAPEKERLHQ